jgi:hypothetical protein
VEQVAVLAAGAFVYQAEDLPGFAGDDRSRAFVVFQVVYFFYRAELCRYAPPFFFPLEQGMFQPFAVATVP